MLGKLLMDNGVRKVHPGETADICVINTCSVTELADKKCRQSIRRIGRLHPGAFVVVTGCYAQLKPEEVGAIEGVDLVVGSNQKLDIVDSLNDYFSGQELLRNQVLPIREASRFVPSCSAEDRTRHFLKVQDGCDYYCTYCTIPFARGRSRNGKISDLVRMAEDAACDGAREIVLTGVNIGDFGKSTGETFCDLICALDRVEGVDRFRISSIEPDLLTDEIIDFVSASDRFAPHFHIPLQSGSDTVLKLMRRRYDTALFTSRVNRIRERMPDAFIGIDVIVGARGETDRCFAETRDYLEALPFSQLHVFNYSERPGTQALKIEHPVDAKTRQERSRQLLEMSDRKTKAFYRSQIGIPHQVIFEHTKRGKKMAGFTENYIRVEATYDPELINRLIPVVPVAFTKDETALTI